MIRRPPRSTLFPYRRSSDLGDHRVVRGAAAERAGARIEDPAGIRAILRVALRVTAVVPDEEVPRDRKSTRLNSSHGYISYAVFCLKKKKIKRELITKLELVQ